MPPNTDDALLPGRLLRRAGPARPVDRFRGVQIDDPRLAPDRTRLGYIPTPTVCSNCTFGGDGMRRLFIAASNLLLAIDLAG